MYDTGPGPVEGRGWILRLDTPDTPSRTDFGKSIDNGSLK